MRRIEVSFVGSRRQPVKGWLMLLIGLGLFSLAMLAFVRQTHQIQRLHDDIQHMQQPVRAVVTTTPVNTEKLGQLVKQMAIAKQTLGIPWNELFLALEHVPTKNIILLAVEPDAQQRKFRVTAQATDYEQMVDYVRQLNEASFLQDCILISHQLKIELPNQPIYFVVEGSWKS